MLQPKIVCIVYIIAHTLQTIKIYDGGLDIICTQISQWVSGLVIFSAPVAFSSYTYYIHIFQDIYIVYRAVIVHIIIIIITYLCPSIFCELYVFIGRGRTGVCKKPLGSFRRGLCRKGVDLFYVRERTHTYTPMYICIYIYSPLSIGGVYTRVVSDTSFITSVVRARVLRRGAAATVQAARKQGCTSRVGY